VKTDWDRSATGWVYWLRNLYWFADDERVVVYFLKAEGGPHPLLFSGASDNKWFLKEPSQ
jgi:hypothetical protein